MFYKADFVELEQEVSVCFSLYKYTNSHLYFRIFTQSRARVVNKYMIYLGGACVYISITNIYAYHQSNLPLYPPIFLCHYKLALSTGVCASGEAPGMRGSCLREGGGGGGPSIDGATHTQAASNKCQPASVRSRPWSGKDVVVSGRRVTSASVEAAQPKPSWWRSRPLQRSRWVEEGFWLFVCIDFVCRSEREDEIFGWKYFYTCSNVTFFFVRE